MKKILVALLVFALVVPTAVASGPPPPGPPPPRGGIPPVGPKELIPPALDLADMPVLEELAGMELGSEFEKRDKGHQLVRSLSDEQRASIGQLLADNPPPVPGNVGDSVPPIQSVEELGRHVEALKASLPEMNRWKDTMSAGLAGILTPEQYALYQDSLLPPPQMADVGPQTETDCYYAYLYGYYAYYYSYYAYLYAYYAYAYDEDPFLSYKLYMLAYNACYLDYYGYVYAYYAYYYYYNATYACYAYYFFVYGYILESHTYPFAEDVYYLSGGTYTYYAYAYSYYAWVNKYYALVFAKRCCEEEPGTIIVKKQTDPKGKPDSFTFTGDAAGTIRDGEQIVVSGLQPGTYTSQETVPSGWKLTNISCDDTNSSGDVNTRTATFRLEAGETVTCTFTNTEDKRGTIIVKKQTDPDGAPDSFTFTGDAAGTISDGQQIEVSDLQPGTYTSRETVPSGWKLTNCKCDDDNSSCDVNTQTATFRLEAGETVKCTFYNTEEGTIIVKKQTDPDGAPDSFTFTGDAAGTIKDGQRIKVSGLQPGTYTSRETVPSGWKLTNCKCDDDNSSCDVNTQTATFRLEAGETVKCTFYNKEEDSCADAGFWQNDGKSVEFYVTTDRAYVDNFAIYIYVPECGYYKITHTPYEPISDRCKFSFSGSYYASGTFSTQTKASGTTGLDHFWIPGCGYVSGGPWSWVARWRSSAQPSVIEPSEEPVLVEPVSDETREQNFLGATLMKIEPPPPGASPP